MQEFIPSSPTLHTGIALCAGCPCARTAQHRDQQVSVLSSSHTTCPRLGAHLTVSPSPPSCDAAKGDGERLGSICLPGSLNCLSWVPTERKQSTLGNPPGVEVLGGVLQRPVLAALIPPLTFKGKRQSTPTSPSCLVRHPGREHQWMQDPQHCRGRSSFLLLPIPVPVSQVAMATVCPLHL